MKALVYYGPEILKWEDVSDVFPKDNEVLIKVKAVGICGSDVHGYLGITGRRTPPMIMGHEFTGVIESVGRGVKNIKVGDVVTPYPIDFCEECEMCKNGDFHLCYNRKLYGVLSNNGAFSEYICMPEKLCFKIRDGVSYSVGTLIEPLSVAYRAVNHAGDLTGKTVIIVGSGTIGLLTLAVVRMRNPSKILITDLSSSRLEAAEKMGADTVINTSEIDLKEKIDSETGGKGVDIAFEAVGASLSVQQAMAALKTSGRAIWIGNNEKIININMQEVVIKELKIQGSYTYTFQEFREVAKLINDNKFNVGALISLEAPMEQGPELFKRLAGNPGSLVKVILIN